MIQISLLLLTTLIMMGLREANASNVWNQLATFEGQLSPQDYTEDSIQGRAYILTLLPNERFSLTILGQKGNTQLLLQGTTMTKPQNMSLHSYGYSLQGQTLTPIKGSITYETGWGVTWKYNIQINQMRISLHRIEVRYKYLFTLLVVVFGVSSLFIFSLNQKLQGKIIFNLKIRSHPIVLLVIILKVFWVGGCFLITGYISLFQLPIWGIIIFYGIYLLSLSPSIIHLLFLCSAAQRNIVQSQFYQSKSKEVRIFIILGAAFLVLLIFMVSLAFSKGIAFYYVFTINNLFIYIHTWKSKKFAYGPLIFYDFLLTFALTIFSLFYPISYFSLVTFKQMVLFWNFYGFILLFGIIFMKKLIRSEIVEQIQLREYSLDSSEIQRQTKQTRQPQSAQIIEQTPQ